MRWDEIEAVFGSTAAMLAAINAVLVETGDPEIRVGTLYVWRSRGLPRGRRWHLAEALRRAGQAVDPRTITSLCPAQETGEGSCEAA
jgi:hypothetical protein